MAVTTINSKGPPLVRDLGEDMAYKNGIYAWSRTLTILDPNRDFTTTGLVQFFLFDGPGGMSITSPAPSANVTGAGPGQISATLLIGIGTFTVTDVWYEIVGKDVGGVFIPYMVGYLKVIK